MSKVYENGSLNPIAQEGRWLMLFNKLKKAIKDVVFDKLRIDNDNYFEAVILKQELAKLVMQLERFFGSPLWPAKKRLPLQVEEAIKDCGGILPGQTLYYLNEGNYIVFAMLWPWQDGLHTTLKIKCRQRQNKPRGLKITL